MWDHLGVTGHPRGALSEIMVDFAANRGSQNEAFFDQFSIFYDLLTSFFRFVFWLAVGSSPGTGQSGSRSVNTISE